MDPHYRGGTPGLSAAACGCIQPGWGEPVPGPYECLGSQAPIISSHEGVAFVCFRESVRHEVLSREARSPVGSRLITT